MVIAIIITLLFTIAIETTIAFTYFHLRGKQLATVAIAQVITNPIMNLCYVYFYTKIPVISSQVLMAIALEAIAINIETTIYRKFDIEEPIKVALITNGATILLSLACAVLLYIHQINGHVNLAILT